MKFLSEYFNTGTVKQQNKKRLGALLICVTSALLVIALVALVIASIATAIGNRAPNEGDDTSDSGSGIPTDYTTTDFAEQGYTISAGNLILVDAEHPYVGTPNTVLFDTHETRAKTQDGAIIYSIGGRYDLAATEETVVAFNAMMAAFYAESSDDCIYISNAYNQKAVNQVSGFETGTVLALKYYEDYNQYGNDPDHILSIYNVEKYEWIYENAAKYGFIQVSKAEGQENIFRYVGAAHASQMKTRTLSEYLDLLKEKHNVNNRLTTSVSVSGADGKNQTTRYNVYYVSATETPVVPTKNKYTVSGNNIDGYIITVDMTTATK